MMIKVNDKKKSEYLALIKERKATLKAIATQARNVGETLGENSAKGAIDQLKMIEQMLKSDQEVFLNEDDLIILGL